MEENIEYFILYDPRIKHMERFVCMCDIKENAELIAKILIADSENKVYECCETCKNYFSENAAESCIKKESE